MSCKLNPGDQSRQYDLVSSLYGQGTVLGWFLTVQSVFVSWLWHPRKRKSGSIDIDLIAVLVLPTVAAGHVLSQVSHLTLGPDILGRLEVSDLQYAQMIAAIRAPLKVIDCFLVVDVALILTALWNGCLRRAMSVAAIGLLCFIARTFVHFSAFKEAAVWYRPCDPHSDRSLFTKATAVDLFAHVFMLIEASYLALLCCKGVVFLLNVVQAKTTNDRGHSILPKDTCTSSELAGPDQAALVSTLLLGLSMYFRSNGSEGLRSAISFRRFCFPQSSSNFSDLDQAVAVSAGATTLGFSLYSIAKAQLELRGRGLGVGSTPVEALQDDVSDVGIDHEALTGTAGS
jgi:hypothetical protein